MNKELLPIGTVVLLEGGTKKVMICGYSSKAKDEDKVYDYNGCVFPEGFLNNTFCLFDKKQIQDVCYMGYIDNDYNKQVDKILSTNLSSAGNGLTYESNSSSNAPTKRGRTPKAPTNPMSKSEMLSKYGVTKMSRDD